MDGADAKKREEKLLNFGFVFFVALNSLESAVYYLTMPTLAQYVVLLNYPLSLAGILLGLFSISALVVRPFCGWLCDNRNRKTSLIAGLCALGVSVIGCALTKNIYIMFVLRLMQGMSFSLVSTVIIACATNYIPAGRLGEGVGIMGLGNIVVSAIGPPIGLWICDTRGYGWCFGLAGSVSILGGVVLLFIKLRGAAPAAPPKGHFSINAFIGKKVVFYAVLAGAFAMGTGIVSSFIALTAEGRRIENIGLFFTVYAISMFLFRPISGRLADRKGLSYVLLPSYILTASAMLIIANGRTLWVMLLCGILLAFGQGAGQPSLQAHCIKLLDKEHRGVAVSTYYLGVDAGNGLGSMVGGAVSGAFGYNAMYYGCAGVMLAALTAYLARDKLIRRV